MDVGDIYVWNDLDCLYVWYEVTKEDWYLTETHLDVKCDKTAIPQTPKDKKGGPNPIPGQFTYEDYFEPETSTSACFSIPIPDCDGNQNLCDSTPVIAAHAVVGYTETGTITPDLTWQRSTEPGSTAFFTGYGAAWTPAQGFTIPLDPAQGVWDNGLYYNNGVPAGREWASWKYAYTEPDGGSYAGYSDLRRFRATFTVPDGYTVTSGSLYTPDFMGGIPINDNVYIFVNGELLFWGGTRVNQIPGGLFEGMAGIQASRGATEPVQTDRWYIPGTIPEVTAFAPGVNTIDVFTEENERWGGMGKLVLELDYEYMRTETAWGEGSRFNEKGNWGMYFSYPVQCCEAAEGLVNGGFEAPDIADNSWMIFPSGTPNLGWVVEWYDGSATYDTCNRPATALLEIHDAIVVPPVTAAEGDQYAELDTDWGACNYEPASVTIHQDICTYPGQMYRLEFKYTPRPNVNCALLAEYPGGSWSTSGTGDGSSWSFQTLTFTATDWESRIAFTETGTADSLGMFLDAVSVGQGQAD